MTAGATADLPEALAAIVDDFTALSQTDRLQLLLEFSQGLPDLPERYAAHRELLESVPECQSPIFLIAEVDEADGAGGAGADSVVHLHFSAPAEAPTTRGFAGILHEGLDGQSVDTVLSVLAGDLGMRLSLTDSVSPLRLRGLSGMLSRIQRQVQQQVQ